MATIEFVKKVPAGGLGVWNYTYNCKCDENSDAKEIVVSSSNDSQAEILAQMQCEDNCNKPVAFSANVVNYRDCLSSISKAEKANASFVAWVNHIDDDGIVVELCTGGMVEVPHSIIKHYDTIGVMSSGDKEVAVGHIVLDTDKPEGRALAQTAKLLEFNISTSRKTVESHRPLDEVHKTISIRCSGRACNPTHSYWTSKYPITDYSLKSVSGCNAWGLTQIGSNRLRITHDSLGGVICGTNYSGQVDVDVVWFEPDDTEK